MSRLPKVVVPKERLVIAMTNEVKGAVDLLPEHSKRILWSAFDTHFNKSFEHGAQLRVTTLASVEEAQFLVLTDYGKTNTWLTMDNSME